MAAEDIHDFPIKLSNQTSSPVTSGIEIVPGIEVPDVQISAAAVFKNDKLVGWLDLQETRGLLGIINEFGHGMLETNIAGKPEQNIALQTIRSQVKITPTLSNGKIRIELKILNAWLSVLIGYGLAAVLGLILLSLGRRFPNKTFVQYLPAVLGKIPGKIAGFLLSCGGRFGSMAKPERLQTANPAHDGCYGNFSGYPFQYD
jgi:hypothetical protein